MIGALRLRQRASPIIATNGIFLIIIGASAFLVAIADMILGGGNATPFWISGMIAAGIGGMAVLGEFDARPHMSRRQIILSVLSAWIVSALAAAPPFMLGAPHLSFEYALFEAVSAVTTTGATVITGLDHLPPSILFWRSLLHWYGGMGVVIGAMMLFPAMRIGGMQFFLRVGFESSDKVLPSARALARATMSAYLALTFICYLAYMLAGMPQFDALNMAMSTMATGGLAVSDSSFGIYPGAPEYVASFFMIIAGFPLLVFVMAFRGKLGALKRDPQIRAFLGVYFAIIAMITLYRLATGQGGFEEIFRDAMFNGASLLTGTGFTNGDFELWGSFPVAVLLFATFIGGCTGSTCGAIKIFRYQVLIELIRVRIRAMHYPHGIFKPRYDGRPLDERVMESVAAFFMIYLSSLALLTVLFGICGLDLVTGFSAAVSAVGNIGPGLGSEIGPMGNYSGFQTPELFIYLVAMIVGRLEFMIFYTLLLPGFWRH